MAPNFREVISSFSVEQILKELSAVDAVASPWAILLVRFRDNQSALPSNTIYNDLFTSVGIGKQNMVDFFRDMSHGKIDISGSKVLAGTRSLTTLQTTSAIPRPDRENWIAVVC